MLAADISITLSATAVTLVVSYLIPALTSLITKANASTGLKQFITGLLAAVNGLLTSAIAIDGSAFLSQSSIILALGSFLAAQAAYVGIYKPHNIAAKTAPTKGLG